MENNLNKKSQSKYLKEEKRPKVTKIHKKPFIKNKAFDPDDYESYDDIFDGKTPDDDDDEFESFNEFDDLDDLKF